MAAQAQIQAVASSRPPIGDASSVHPLFGTFIFEVEPVGGGLLGKAANERFGVCQ